MVNNQILKQPSQNIVTISKDIVKNVTPHICKEHLKQNIKVNFVKILLMHWWKKI